jgi:hypothetical protein
MDSKKVIEKLFKIAENQQKIINKLAQTAGLVPAATNPGTQDVSAQVAQTLAKIPEAARAKAGIQEAQFGAQSGFLDVKLKFPSMKDMGTPASSDLQNKLKAALQGAQFTDASGKPVAAKEVKVTGVFG